MKRGVVNNVDLMQSRASGFVTLDPSEGKSMAHRRGSTRAGSILKPLRAMVRHLKIGGEHLMSSALSSSAENTAPCHVAPSIPGVLN